MDSTEKQTAKKSWVTEREQTLFQSKTMQMVQLDCRSSEDPAKTHSFYTLKSRDWCNVIPITEDGKVVLVRQFRIGSAGHTLEFPGGVIDHEGEDEKASALRELSEETGYAPLPGAKCISLGAALSNPAMINNRTHSFIVG